MRRAAQGVAVSGGGAMGIDTAHERDHSEAQFRALFEHASDGVFVADLDGRFTDVNGAGCRLLGCVREEIVGEPIAAFVAPDDLGRLERALRELAGGAALIAEWSLRRKDGSLVPVEVSAKRVLDGRLLAFVRDVTERRRAERELRRLARLQAVVAEFGQRALGDGAEADLLQEAAEVVARTLEVERAHVLEIVPGDDGAERVRLCAGVGWKDGVVGVAGWPRAAEDPTLEARSASLPRELGAEAASSVSVVIRTERGPFGALGAHARASRTFSPDEVDFLRTMANVLGAAIERRRDEDERRLWADTLNAIISISADAMISIGKDQRIVLFNQGAERMYGWPMREAVGQPIDVLIPPRLRARHRAHVERFLASDRAGIGVSDLVGLRRNGEEFSAEASISRTEVAGRLLLHISVRDVTERRRVQEEHQALAETGEALIAAAPDLDATLDAIVRASVRAFADVCVVDLVDADHRRRLRIAHADAAKADLAAALERVELDAERPGFLAPVIQSGRSLSFPELSPARVAAAVHGERRRLWRAVDARSAIVVPLLARERVLGLLAFVASRNRRRFDDRDLRLAERIAVLAALAVENARLFDVAQRAIRARDEVLGIVAHDLRNPLNNVLMLVEVLRRTDGKGAAETADRVRRAAHRMNRLVQDMLDVARLEAGALAVRRAAVAPREVLAEVIESQRQAANAASIVLSIDVPADLPRVHADRDRLLQVLENLIGNALKFTPRDGRVTVRAIAGAAEVVFEVEDTGPGVPREQLPHLFDRFWQRKADKRGAGLGLAIAKGIVEAHGGRIWVETSPGRGLTVRFSIPRAAQPDRQAAAAP